MNILCAIGQQDAPEMLKRLQEELGTQHNLYLLHVIDTGPRRELEAFMHRPGSRHPPPPEQARRIDAVEITAGQAALDEARMQAEQLGFNVQVDLQRGKPEQIIVQSARDRGCHLIVIWNSEGAQGRPLLGPESVGHTARFVLDHAPCDVLFLRGK